MKAITPERRTELLANSMQDVAVGFVCVYFLGWLIVTGLFIGGYVAMGLFGCAAVVEPAAARWLRLAAGCTAAAGALTTAHFFLPFIHQGWLLAAVGLGVFAAALGFSSVAAWFGGVQRWQRARAAAVVWLCAISMLIGMGLGTGQASVQQTKWIFRLPDSTAAGLAFAVALASLIYISMAFSDLRSRVKAAMAQQAAAAPEAVRG